MNIPMNDLGVVKRNIVRADAAAVAKLSRFGVATIHEAMGRVGLMDPQMRPIYSGAHVCGTAVTVLLQPGDNWMMHVAAEQVQPGDVVVGITTSGNSRNIVAGLEEAKRLGATTIAFTGNGGGEVAEIADIVLVGPDGYSALVQEVHITLGHIICDLVDQALA